MIQALTAKLGNNFRASEKTRISNLSSDYLFERLNYAKMSMILSTLKQSVSSFVRHIIKIYILKLHDQQNVINCSQESLVILNWSNFKLYQFSPSSASSIGLSLRICSNFTLCLYTSSSSNFYLTCSHKTIRPTFTNFFFLNSLVFSLYCQIRLSDDL